MPPTKVRAFGIARQECASRLNNSGYEAVESQYALPIGQVRWHEGRRWVAPAVKLRAGLAAGVRPPLAKSVPGFLGGRLYAGLTGHEGEEMTAPRISVVVPFYNNGDVLADCLQSIASQTFRIEVPYP